MAEEEIKEDLQEDVQGEPEAKETPASSEDAVAAIGEKIKSAAANSEEQETSTSEIDIPQEFYDAAAEQGWEEKDIFDMLTEDGKLLYTHQELLDMIPAITGETPGEPEGNSKEGDKDTPSPNQQEPDKDSQDDEKTQKLLERIDALEKALGERQKEDETKTIEGLVDRASEMFDKASEEFPIFGKTKDLPKFPDGRIIPNSPAMKARKEIWDVAFSLYGSGHDFDKAMSLAYNAYKGQNLSKSIERKVIKGLKSREKNLSGKRVTHETDAPSLNGPEIIKKILMDAGVK